MKKRLLIVARLLVAVAAMYLVSRKINWQEIKQFEWSMSLFWLLPAFVFYNLSQCISAFRLLQYYRLHQTSISYAFNLRLYYRGMFYNLFLPGGIGGDAYKIIALKNSGNTYRQLTTATLLDRVTGLGILILVISILSLLVSTQGMFDDFFSILPLLVVAGIPVYYFVVWFFFRPFHKVLPFAAFLSFLVQGFQLAAFLCILYALNVVTGSIAGPAFLFFTSSVIAALPLSIGGIGTRELALATGAGLFNFSETKLVSASLLFFLMVVISSLIGWAMTSSSRKPPDKPVTI